MTKVNLRPHLNTEKTSLILETNAVSVICTYLYEIYCKNRQTDKFCFFFLLLTLSIHPTEVQKVAGVALLTINEENTNYNQPNSFSTTEPFLSAPRMTIDLLHVPNIRHMWLFQRGTTWCHLCAGHICSLLLWF